MTVADRLQDIQMLAARRPFGFTYYVPRDVPGFESDIADVVGCSRSQTNNLLDAIDIIDEEDHRFHVRREQLEEAKPGTKGKQYPAKYRGVVSSE